MQLSATPGWVVGMSPSSVLDMAKGPSSTWPSPVRLLVSHEYWPDTEQDSLSILSQRANVTHALKELNRPQSSKASSMFTQNTYWILGIVLPVVFVIALINQFLAKIRAQQARAKREKRRLERWLAKAGAESIRKKRENAKSAEGTFKFGAWMSYQWTRLKYRGHTDARTKRRERERDSWDARHEQLSQIDEWQKEVLGTVFMGEWEGVKKNLAKSRSLLPFAVGALAVAIGLLLGLVVGDNWMADALLACLVVLGLWGAMLVGRKGDSSRPGAFLWGSSIAVYLGLNAIELSAYPDVNNYFDSQTVTVMFVCLLMILGLPDAKRKVDKTVKQFANESQLWLPGVGEVKERWWRVAMVLAYVVLSAHCVWKAGGMIFSEQHVEGLAPITAVTLVTLLLPLTVLVERERVRGGRESNGA